MRKLEDLSIGNYVRYNGEIMQVMMLSTYDVYCDLYRKSENEPTVQVFSNEMKDVEGVEITEEILRKNEFVNIEPQMMQWEDGAYWVWYEFDQHKLGIYSNNRTMDGESIPMLRAHIDNVHELQNFLRMVGVEKEIEL